ncbi:MAG TPA: H-type small acid-soluble spore protein [Syntrophomonas sp.]|nr:H-type small acid-soluble spore protein [Syntrophomonas sp.]HRW12126.1 H-type small acid-soluble spore protein [Syntrophomonas sp.]
MDIKRANEIFDSLGVIEVFYQGSPVWIEKVAANRIQVQDLRTKQRFEVSVYNLSEE